METLARVTLHNRLLTLIFLGLMIALGFWAWERLPIDAFPDVTSVQVMILSKAPGLSSEDVEQQVTFPIEQRMSGVHKVSLIRSTSKAGLSQIVVIFEDGVDPFFARQLVFERLQDAREEMPAGVNPEIAPLSTGLGEVFQYTLESDTLDAMELRTLQDWLVAPQLRTIPGVSEVNSFGGLVRQHHVLVNPDLLQKYAISLAEVVDVLEKNNVNAGGKFLLQGWEQKYVRSVGLLRTAKDIESIVIQVKSGVPILVGDVAEVVIGSETRQGAVTKDGKGETVAGMAIMTRGANSKDVVERINRLLPGIRKSLPAEVRLNVFYDRTYLIEACIKTVTGALYEGGLCVIPVLFLFLAELRTGILVVLSLPLTFLLSFLLMKVFGVSSNLMSLGGLAFSVGLVCDATVVVLENIRRHLAAAKPGEDELPIFSRAIAEVARPTAFSVLIIVLVILPLFSLTGMEAKMFNPFSLTMLMALSASLVVAFVLMPVLAYYGMPRGGEKDFFVNRLMRFCYEYVLGWCLRLPGVAVFLAIFGLLVAVRLIPLMGLDFMPALNEGAVAINAVRLPNASLEGAIKVSTEVEKHVMRLPEVATVVSKSGRAEISEDPMGPEQTDFIIMLKPSSQVPHARNQQELVTAFQTELLKFPGLRFSYSQPIALRVNELISGIKSDVAIKVFGDDLEVLTAFSRRIAEITAQVPGAHDTRAAQMSSMDQVDVVIDRAAASRYGINASQINEVVEAGVGGKVVGNMIENQRKFAIQVRFPEEFRMDEEALARLKIPGKEGLLVPLGEVARIRRVTSPIEVVRENGRRRMVVETNVRNRDLGGFITDLQRRLDPLHMELPTGYRIEFGGQFENQQRAMGRLALAVPLSLILIAVLLVMALGSVKDAVIVLLNLPFSVVGGVIAVVLSQMTLSVSAGVAFIVLLGIAVQNGVILVTFFRQRLDAGIPLEEAIQDGCALRFRPLMMTSLTTFISHLPMLLAVGSGAETQQPLAVVVMGGIVTSSLLTMLVLPVIFRWSEQWVKDMSDDA
jgi:cobalt-zinc-cadmium resistance protein CzcA